MAVVATNRDWSRLAVRGVGKSYLDSRGTEYVALEGVSLEIERGEFYCLLGPSGCGKSTLLNLIAGFEEPSAGTIGFASGSSERPIIGPGADRSVIFQEANAALFPWLDVYENVAFGPRLHGAPKDALEAKLRANLAMVGLDDHVHKFPYELSGGMRQRLQIARALVMEPEVMLMDEPLAALDAITKRAMQRELSRIWSETGRTVVYVTHDIVEAVLLGTRIAVMTMGPCATIKTEIAVAVPRPRDPADPAVAGYVRELERLIDEEVNPLATAAQ